MPPSVVSTPPTKRWRVPCRGPLSRPSIGSFSCASIARWISWSSPAISTTAPITASARELAFQRAMRRLADAGIDAFVVRGNHDPADGWSAGLELPDSVVVFSADEVERREVIRDGEVVCAVYGRSFGTRQVTENLSLGFGGRKVIRLRSRCSTPTWGSERAGTTTPPARSMIFVPPEWTIGRSATSTSREGLGHPAGGVSGLDPGSQSHRGRATRLLRRGARRDGATEEFVETRRSDGGGSRSTSRTCKHR